METNTRNRNEPESYYDEVTQRYDVKAYLSDNRVSSLAVFGPDDDNVSHNGAIMSHYNNEMHKWEQRQPTRPSGTMRVAVYTLALAIGGFSGTIATVATMVL